MLHEGREHALAALDAEREAILGAAPEEMADALESLVSDIDRAATDKAFSTYLYEGMAEGLRDSAEGWVDDDLAFVKPWGFDVRAIGGDIRIWQGTADLMVLPAHGRWLAAALPHARFELRPTTGTCRCWARPGSPRSCDATARDVARRRPRRPGGAARPGARGPVAPRPGCATRRRGRARRPSAGPPPPRAGGGGAGSSPITASRSPSAGDLYGRGAEAGDLGRRQPRVDDCDHAARAETRRDADVRVAHAELAAAHRADRKHAALVAEDRPHQVDDGGARRPESRRCRGGCAGGRP